MGLFEVGLRKTQQAQVFLDMRGDYGKGYWEADAMLEEMQLVCMMLLLIGHGMLIRGCFKINESIPKSTDRLCDKYDGISSILDEMADIVDEFATGAKEAPLSNPITGVSIPEMITSLLMSKMAMPSNHADPLTKERPIYEIDPSPPNQAENESNELSS